MKIIIADDHLMVREGVKRIVSKIEGAEVVAECSDGAEAAAQVFKTACDLLIVDINMPAMTGLEALRTVKARRPETKVVILSMYGDPESVNRAISGKADGYILKDDDEQTFLSVLRNVVNGIVNFSPRVQSVLAARENQNERSPEELLSPREMEIFRCMIEGYSNKETASKLGISLRTVDFHKRNIRDTLGVESLVDLVRLAHRYNLL